MDKVFLTIEQWPIATNKIFIDHPNLNTVINNLKIFFDEASRQKKVLIKDSAQKISLTNFIEGCLE
jgi:short-subunit dehydrogenase involved in D-alanine esterification of teichoic acids